MSKSPKLFIVTKRTDAKTFRLTINFTSGLPERVCAEWRRHSFQELPDELAHYRNPKTKSAAEVGALALISYLKKKQEDEGSARRVITEDKCHRKIVLQILHAKGIKLPYWVALWI